MTRKKIIAAVATFIIVPHVVRAALPVEVKAPAVSTLAQQQDAAKVSEMATNIRASVAGLLATGAVLLWYKGGK